MSYEGVSGREAVQWCVLQMVLWQDGSCRGGLRALVGGRLGSGLGRQVDSFQLHVLFRLYPILTTRHWRLCFLHWSHFSNLRFFLYRS